MAPRRSTAGIHTRELLVASLCLVSVASIWEVAIKHRLGKLDVTPAAFRDQSLGAGAALLPVLDAHVIETAQLPLVHHDPYRCAEDCVYDAC